MKIEFIGTGSAFALRNYQTNTIIERNGKRLLIDAGTDLKHSLHNLSMDYMNLDAIYITHLHSDHIGGMEYLAFTTYFDPRVKEKVKLYSNFTLVQDMWNQSLQGGLASIQARQMHLEDYFDVEPILPNGEFEWEGIRFEMVQSVHVMNKYSIMPSFGLMITDPDTGMKVYYTSDTQFNPNQIMDFYNQADLVIQDCETYPFKSGVHANFMDLVTLDEDVKKKMILQHYADNIMADCNRFNPFELVQNSPEDIKSWLEEYCENIGKIKPEWNENAKEAGFISWDDENYGFVKQGVTFDMNDLQEKLKGEEE